MYLPEKQSVRSLKGNNQLQSSHLHISLFNGVLVQRENQGGAGALTGSTDALLIECSSYLSVQLASTSLSRIH